MTWRKIMMMFIGIVIVAITIGYMYTMPIGFLTLGVGLIILGIVDYFTPFD